MNNSSSIPLVALLALASGVSLSVLASSADPVFVEVGPMQAPRVYHTATQLQDGTVPLAGGVVGTDTSTSAEVYDPITYTSTTTVAPMAIDRGSHRATLLEDGTVLIAGGYSSSVGGAVSSAEIFDPVARVFSPTGSMLFERTAFTATRLGNGKVLIAGGNTHDSSEFPLQAELYDATAHTFSPTAGAMAVGRHFHQATLLDSGKVLITGGANNDGVVGEAELYDPDTDTFQPAGQLAIPRTLHTATRLSNGDVVMTGGTLGGASWVAGVETYSIATGQFALSGELILPRAQHTATLLAGDKILVAGGEPGGRDIAELFDPYAPSVVRMFRMASGAFAQEALAISGQSALIFGGARGDTGGNVSTVQEFRLPAYAPPTVTLGPDQVLTLNNLGTASTVLTAVTSSPTGLTPFTFDWSTGEHSDSIVYNVGVSELGSTVHVEVTAIDAAGEIALARIALSVQSPFNTLTSLAPASVWLGLKNSDDIGTKFDLLAEVLKNGEVIGSGQLNGVPGGGSGFNNAVLRTLSLSLPAWVTFTAGDALSLRLSVRIATSGHRSGTARIWFNTATANTRFGATIGDVADTYFVIGPTPASFALKKGSVGSGPIATVDVTVNRAVGGNPFKPFGTWSVVVQ